MRKEKEKKAEETITEIVNVLAKKIKEEEKKYINDMVNLMVSQSHIMSRARKNGVLTQDEKVMERLKKEYLEKFKINKTK